ncbi:hypothetical protein IW262DRAFT_343827 [Armillaria fumosa]|nr:hypothetical protein IW262DRAFT_343827 [Armillaria fumosa]
MSSTHQMLTQDAKVFGGDALTATDIALRAGKKEIGDASLVSAVSDEVVVKTQYAIEWLLESVVDRMKTSPEDCTLLLVGGGSIIVPPALTGVKEIILPPFHSAANAVGAPIAVVSGEIDTIEILQGKSLPDTLERIKVEAMAKAVEAGADPRTIRIAAVYILPVQYVTNQAMRIIVKAIGELGTAKLFQENQKTVGSTYLKKTMSRPHKKFLRRERWSWKRSIMNPTNPPSSVMNGSSLRRIIVRVLQFLLIHTIHAHMYVFSQFLSWKDAECSELFLARY